MHSVWYNREFYLARRIAYAVIVAMVVTAFVAPIHYACGASGVRCLACGVRTGLIALIHLDIAGAVAANPLTLVIAVSALFAIADCAVHFVARRCR